MPVSKGRHVSALLGLFQVLYILWSHIQLSMFQPFYFWYVMHKKEYWQKHLLAIASF